MDQVDKVLWDLKHNPASRRIMTNIYTFADLSEMALYPCAYSMTFNVSGNKLNAILNQRSQDMLAANNWNVVQYAVLTMMMAQVAGFEPGEACSVKDLLYAMMLPSGADAAVMLATHAAGSEAAFAEQMNALAAEMGLQHTHFVNCTGLHEDDHLSSVNDIARILLYALEDPLARQIMSAYRHTTTASPQHEEGIELVSTTLSRLVGNELESLSKPLHIIGGKTGYTNPAGQCLATWAENAEGEEFVSVIAGSTALKPLDAIGDTLTLYQLTCEPLDAISRITVDEADLPDYEHY
jgi:D-alanyl-D-alanine carboxypeptidase